MPSARNASHSRCAACTQCRLTAVRPGKGELFPEESLLQHLRRLAFACVQPDLPHCPDALRLHPEDILQALLQVGKRLLIAKRGVHANRRKHFRLPRRQGDDRPAVRKRGGATKESLRPQKRLCQTAARSQSHVR